MLISTHRDSRSTPLLLKAPTEPHRTQECAAIDARRPNDFRAIAVPRFKIVVSCSACSSMFHFLARQAARPSGRGAAWRFDRIGDDQSPI